MSKSLPLKLLFVAFAAVLASIAAVTNAQPIHSPFTNFVHPEDGDTIHPGGRVRVVAVTMHEDPPADARLQVTEDAQVTWVDLDFRVQGRVIFADYVNGGVSVLGTVQIRTISESSPWFSSAIELFVE